MAVDLADESIAPDMIVDFQWVAIKQNITDSVEQFFKEQKQALETEKEERMRKAEELLKRRNPQKDGL